MIGCVEIEAKMILMDIGLTMSGTKIDCVYLLTRCVRGTRLKEDISKELQ